MNTEVTTTNYEVTTMDVGTVFDTSDITIPRLWLMQALSDFVSDGIAKPGDFVNSLEQDIVGSKEDKPVEFIVFNAYKTMNVFHDGEYVETIDFDSNLDWTETITTEDKLKPIEVKRYSSLNFYIVLVDEIKAGLAFPLVLSFKNSSLGAGKKLATFLMKMEYFKKASTSAVFSLSAKQTENDKGKFFVMNVKKSRDTNKTEASAADKWFNTIKTMKVAKDE